MTLEFLNTSFQVVSVILLALTFAVGAGAVWTGYVLGKRQAERIAAAELAAAEANRKAAEASVTAEQAKIEQEKLKTQNLKLQADVERERIERLKLEARFAPRTVTPAQKEALVSILGRVKGIVNIRAPNSTAESGQYANQLRDVFLAAGWNADPVFHGIIGGVALQPGVVVMAQEKSAAGIAIQTAFNQAQIEADYVVVTDVPIRPSGFSVGIDPGLRSRSRSRS